MIVTMTGCHPTLWYENDCYNDWLSNAENVSSVELNGPILAGVAKSCICCYNHQRTGSMPTSVCHFDECPFIEFIFQEPVMVNGVTIAKFHGRHAGRFGNFHPSNVQTVDFNVQEKK